MISLIMVSNFGKSLENLPALHSLSLNFVIKKFISIVVHLK